MKRGDIISWGDRWAIGEAFQQGMFFAADGKNYSMLNMSMRPGAPYADEWLEDGKTIIYEGHDALGEKDWPVHKKNDQPTGYMCENGKFKRAVEQYKQGKEPRMVKVYEKIKAGIWVYNGFFLLTDFWQEEDKNNPSRKVCKFKLEAIDHDEETSEKITQIVEVEHGRLIPTSVKIEVYKRDKGVCRECGETKNLHYDHILPYSKGGTSTDVKNIQILCAKCNLKKGAKII